MTIHSMGPGATVLGAALGALLISACGSKETPAPAPAALGHAPAATPRSRHDDRGPGRSDTSPVTAAEVTRTPDTGGLEGIAGAVALRIGPVAVLIAATKIRKEVLDADGWLLANPGVKGQGHGRRGRRGRFHTADPCARPVPETVDAMCMWSSSGPPSSARLSSRTGAGVLEAISACRRRAVAVGLQGSQMNVVTEQEGGEVVVLKPAKPEGRVRAAEVRPGRCHAPPPATAATTTGCDRR